MMGMTQQLGFCVHLLTMQPVGLLCGARPHQHGLQAVGEEDLHALEHHHVKRRRQTLMMLELFALGQVSVYHHSKDGLEPELEAVDSLIEAHVQRKGPEAHDLGQGVLCHCV